MAAPKTAEWRALVTLLAASANPERAALGLLAAFGSIGAALRATRRRQLAATAGDHAAISALRAFDTLLRAVLKREMTAGPVLNNWEALLDYLHVTMAFAGIESVRLLHLNTRNGLMRDEVIARGSIDQATVHVREVVARTLEIGSASIILVHNHPSGDPEPSRSDIDITHAIIDAGRTIGLTVHDHLVIGASGHVSLRARGLI